MTLYDRFRELTRETLEEFVKEEREEYLNLEFKTINSPDLNNREDKKNLAKALSGFANSAGGIVVWGVDARRNDEGIDCARELRPINNVRRFIARLAELTPSAIHPMLESIEHMQIDGDDGQGFAATFVPESDSAPHMAKLGENRYFKRNGDQFRVMEHFDLEDMFGRRPHPSLELKYDIVPGADVRIGSREVFWEHRIILSIINTGKGSAAGPMLSITLDRPWYRGSGGVDGNGGLGLSKQAQPLNSPWRTYQGTAADLLHASTKIAVCAITTTLEHRGSSPPELNLRYRIAAANHRLVEDSLRLSPDQLTAIANR